MPRVAVSWLLLALLSLGGCADRGSGDDGLRLPALHADPDPLSGGRIVDGEGREVLLRGVNVNALADYWQGRPDFPTVFPLEPGDPARMQAIGWSAVRLLLSWSRVEPEPGEIDASYLDQVEQTVRTLEAHGLYTILDLHQDAWGATLAAPDGTVCDPPAKPALGWDGAPAWATLGGSAPRCATLRELSPAVVASFAGFWSDAPGPGGVGVRTRYVSMLASVMRRFARDTAVAGIDLMNEPNAYGPAQLASLSAMYGDALAAIREAERSAGGFPHLVLFEPGILWSAIGNGAPPDFPRDRDVVYAPHIYTGGFSNGPIGAAAFETARREAAGFGGAPVLSGEWGSDPRRAGDPADDYFLDHQALQDEFRFGATLWTWRESCGDPHKIEDYRAGRVAYVWGEFEVDCQTNAILGTRDDLVGQLARGYARAAPGQLDRSLWEDDTRRLTAAGREAAPGAELVLFHPDPRAAATGSTVSPVVVAGSGLDATRIVAVEGGGSWILARASGGAWSIEVAGAPRERSVGPGVRPAR